MNDSAPDFPTEILEYYAVHDEHGRLQQSGGQLEFARTLDIIVRHLPHGAQRILDVGGGTGPYAFALAGRGHRVQLVDIASDLVQTAARLNRQTGQLADGILRGDARRLPRADRSAQAVLMLGPLYHLTERTHRLQALREAWRILEPGGWLFAAGISRFASALDGLVRKFSLDPEFVKIRDRDLAEGQHRNNTTRLEYFTTAYFHRPEELAGELREAGFNDARVLGVEGPGGLLSDIDERWHDPALKADLLHVARALEAEPSIVGASAHLLALGTKA